MKEMPDRIHNPQTGHTITFLQQAEDTGGKLLKMRLTIPPTGLGPPGHKHRTVTETFTVLSGEVSIMCGGRKLVRVYGPGESVRVPPLTPHRFRNLGTETAEVDLDVAPADDFEDSMRTTFGLVRDGRTTKHGMPKNPLDLALLFELSDTYLLATPMWFQELTFRPLARLAKALGKDPVFPEYTRPPDWDRERQSDV